VAAGLRELLPQQADYILDSMAIFLFNRNRFAVIVVTASAISANLYSLDSRRRFRPSASATALLVLPVMLSTDIALSRTAHLSGVFVDTKRVASILPLMMSRSGSNGLKPTSLSHDCIRGGQNRGPVAAIYIDIIEQ
jgi:hypothetical protein